MGLLSRFRKKKEIIPEITPSPTPDTSPETTTLDNLKAKMELVLTELDSLKTQYAAMNMKIDKISKILEELHKMAQS